MKRNGDLRTGESAGGHSGEGCVRIRGGLEFRPANEGSPGSTRHVGRL